MTLIDEALQRASTASKGGVEVQDDAVGVVQDVGVEKDGDVGVEEDEDVGGEEDSGPRMSGNVGPS